MKSGKRKECCLARRREGSKKGRLGEVLGFDRTEVRTGSIP